jgi:hypothetical protein
MSITLELKVNSSDRKKIYKNVQDKVSVSAILKENTSIINPVMIVSKDSAGAAWASYNYARIPQFNNRYYFIDEIVAETGGKLAYHLTVDPLMTYADSLMGTAFQVARAEGKNKNSPYFVDSEKHLQVDTLQEYEVLGHIPQDLTGNKYVITVAGG